MNAYRHLCHGPYQHISLSQKLKLDIQEVEMQASPLSVAAKNLYIVDWLGGTLPFFFVFFRRRRRRRQHQVQEKYLISVRRIYFWELGKGVVINCSRIDVNGIYSYKRIVIKIVEITMHTADPLAEDYKVHDAERNPTILSLLLALCKHNFEQIFER